MGTTKSQNQNAECKCKCMDDKFNDLEPYKTYWHDFGEHLITMVLHLDDDNCLQDFNINSQSMYEECYTLVKEHS